MTETTPRLALPLIQPGQAQKELFHNEALTLLDASAHPVAEALGTIVPPASPTAGAAWIVGEGAQGEWAGKDGRLACRTTGGWRFVALAEGALVWVRAEGTYARRAGAGWVLGELPLRSIRIGADRVIGPRAGAIPTPAGGATTDTEARSAIASILTALRNHGLIGS